MHRRAICFCYRSAQESCISNQPSLTFRHRTIRRWQRRRLSDVRNGQSSSNENGASTVSPTALKHADSSAKNDWTIELDNKQGLDAKDIYIDDLTATLEAHRETNRASRIRRVHQDADWEAPFLNPVANTEPAPGSNDEANGESDAHSSTLAAPLPEAPIAISAREDGQYHSRVHQGLTPKQWASLYWPADSVQLAEITGKLYKARPDEILEYDACLIQNQGVFSIKTTAAQYPWLASLRETATNQQNSHQRLHDEIKAYEAYIDLSPIEKEAASLLISDVRAIIGKVYPRNPLQVVGSYGTGLANSLSDIDFNLSFPDFEKTPLERGPSPTRDKARKAAGRALVRMHRAVENTNHFFRNVELVHARVPIVKAEHRGTKLKVEIQALSTNQNAKEYVASYLAEFPTLQTLYTVIRSVLHIRDLTNVHKGGLGSYSIFMMVVNALKQASGKFAHDDLANQFLHFLDFYGTADLYKYGFSVDPPRTVSKRGNKMSAKDKITRLEDPMLRGIDILEPYNAQKPYLLFLQDPANPVNDLGRKAYGIKHVQCILGHFSESLKESMRRYDEGPNTNHNWLRTRGFLGNLLEANYESLKSNRRGVRLWLGKRKAALNHESKSKLEQKPRVEAPKDIQAISSGEVRITRSDSTSKGSEVLPTPEANEALALSTTGLPDLQKERAPADVQGTINGEVRTIRSDSAGKKSEDLPAQNGTEDPGLSAADILDPRDVKEHPLPAEDTQQAFSQELINHTMRRTAKSTITAVPEGRKPKSPFHSGWRRWSPTQEDVMPEVKENLDVKAEDRPPREKTDIPTHRTYLLQRLEKRFDKSVFEKLKDLDWYTLVQLNWHSLQDFEIVPRSRNQIITTIQNYVARVPYDDLAASQDRRAPVPVTTTSTSGIDSRTIEKFLQSVGLGRHTRKLKSVNLHRLAAMTRLDFKQKNISIYDANRIMVALRKDGIVTIVAQDPDPKLSARHLNMRSKVLERPSVETHSEGQSPAKSPSKRSEQNIAGGHASQPVESSSGRLDPSSIPEVASTSTALLPSEASAPPEIRRQLESKVSQNTWRKFIASVPEERESDDEEAIVGGWKDYVAQERNKEVQEDFRDSTLWKEAAEDSFPAYAAPISILPRHVEPELQKTRHHAGDIETSVSGLPTVTRQLRQSLMQHLRREKNCDLEAAKNLWASYTEQERLNLVLAYRTRRVPRITPQIRAVSTDPNLTPKHDPPRLTMASASSLQQSTGSGLDPMPEQQNPQPTPSSTSSSQQSSAGSVDPTMKQQKTQRNSRIWRQNSLGELKIGDQPTPVRIRLSRSGPYPDTAQLSEERSTAENERDAAAQQQVAGGRHDNGGNERRKKTAKRVHPTRLESDKQANAGPDRTL